MAEDVRPQLQNALADLRRIPDILAVAIVRRDGLPVVHLLPKSVNPKKIAAMAAAIVGTSEMASTEMGTGTFAQVIVETDGAKMLATGAGRETILVTLVRTDANMGLVLISVDRAVQTIAAIIDGAATVSKEVTA